jgi:type IV pilus assembly protein PilM
MMKHRKHNETDLYFSDASIGCFQRREKSGEVDVHGSIALERGILKNGYVVDPLLLTQKLRSLFSVQKIRPNRVRLVLNSQNVLMRVVDVLRADIGTEGLFAHLDAELGKSLHFPFPVPRVSYHLIRQDETSAKILAVASDDRLLNDYLDIFDRLGVKEVVFDMPALALYSLYSNTVGVNYQSLMLVTIYDAYFTIKIFEDDIPIFNLVEEFDGEMDTRYEVIDNYMERVANYFQYTISRDEKAIEKIILVSQSERETESEFEIAFADRSIDLDYDFFDIPEMSTTGEPWSQTSLIAYAASLKRSGNLDKIGYFDFRLQRPQRITRVVKLLFMIAFVLFAMVSLLYLPQHAQEEAIYIARNQSAVLAAQLADLVAERAQHPLVSEQDRAYGEAYEALLAFRQTLALYVQTIEESAIDVDIVKWTYDATSAAFVVTLVGPSQDALEAFLLAIYETYGIADTVSTTRWIAAFPRYQTVGNLQIEVTFLHAKT